MRSIKLAFGKFELREEHSSLGSLSGQREGFGFDFHIHASKRSYAAIELCPLGPFKIGKEVADPSDKVWANSARSASGGARHFRRASPHINSQKDRRVIFRFDDIG
jgi:hypothetical protein